MSQLCLPQHAKSTQRYKAMTIPLVREKSYDTISVMDNEYKWSHQHAGLSIFLRNRIGHGIN